MRARLGWVVSNWRLKLLAVLLTVGLLGVVAFSQNPPEIATVAVRVQYVNLPHDLVLTDYQDSVSVPVIGLRDAVDRYRQSAAGVSIDLAHARAGPRQVYTARPRVDTPGVSPQTSSIPVRLDVQPLETRQLDIEVRTPDTAAGIDIIRDRTFATCGNATDRCHVTVSGAASLVDGLQAYVAYDIPITSASTQTSPNEPVRFERNGQRVELGRERTIPRPSWTPPDVTIQVVTQGGSMTRTVGLTVRPAGAQACGYVITGVDVQPGPFVTVSGPADAVGRLGPSIALDPVNIAGISSNQAFNRSVPVPDGVVASPQGVRVVVSVSQAFSCAAPSPSPRPTV